MKQRKRIAVVLCAVFFASAAILSSCSPKKPEIDTMAKLKSQIKTTDEKTKENVHTRISWLPKTSPDVIRTFIVEKAELTEQKLSEIVPNDLMKETSPGCYYGKTKIDLNDGCEAVVVLKDWEGDETTKNDVYQNRCYSVSVKVSTFLGYARLNLENYYTLGEDGIKEQHGESYVRATGRAGTTTNISAREPVLSDSEATTAGSSNVDMYALYDWKWEMKKLGSAQGCSKLISGIEFDEMDQEKEEIKVKHFFEVKNL